jgi:hypothetical protein
MMIRKLKGSFAVDDGRHLVDRCPCCGQKLDEKAAGALLRSIEARKISIETAAELSNLWFAFELRPLTQGRVKG